jgi:hypothetical protein
MLISIMDPLLARRATGHAPVAAADNFQSG